MNAAFGSPGNPELRSIKRRVFCAGCLDTRRPLAGGGAFYPVFSETVLSSDRRLSVGFCRTIKGGRVFAALCQPVFEFLNEGLDETGIAGELLAEGKGGGGVLAGPDPGGF